MRKGSLTMKMFGWRSTGLFAVMVSLGVGAVAQRISVKDFGAEPGAGKDATPGVLKAIAAAKAKPGSTVVFPKGTYEFFPEHAATEHYFISNHDPEDSRAVAMPIDGVHGLTIDGMGSTFLFHGQTMPVAVTDSSDVTLKNFAIDYAVQHFLFTKVIASSADSVKVKVFAGPKYTIADGIVTLHDGEWSLPARASLEIDPQAMTVAYGARDNFKFGKCCKVSEVSPDLLEIHGLKELPKVGNIFVIRGVDRPDPAIWVAESKDIHVEHVDVNAALGMAFIAQKTENTYLDGFNVKLSPGRYITTNADAVHFSNCKGKIVVENGLYENMLDDGINVHGSFLHVMKLPSPNKVLLEWGHFQTFGFTFAEVGEHLEFSSKRTITPIDHATVTAVKKIDDKHVELTLDKPVADKVNELDLVDNVDWRPSVIYRNNTVQRIRSRGVLFSTTNGVLVENNHFIKTSASGVLIPGEGGDWFESTPSHDVVVRHNEFLDTNLGQPTKAAVTIGPTIRQPLPGDGYSHRHIVIEDNTFTLTGRHMVQALSVDGIVFRNNTLLQSKDFPAAPTAPAFNLTHTRCVLIGGNKLPSPLTMGDLEDNDAKLVHVDELPQTASKAELEKECGDAIAEPKK